MKWIRCLSVVVLFVFSCTQNSLKDFDPTTPIGILRSHHWKMVSWFQVRFQSSVTDTFDYYMRFDSCAREFAYFIVDSTQYNQNYTWMVKNQCNSSLPYYDNRIDIEPLGNTLIAYLGVDRVPFTILALNDTVFTIEYITQSASADSILLHKSYRSF